MYERGIKGWLKHLDFILLDMLSLALAFFTAFSLRFSHAWGVFLIPAYFLVVRHLKKELCIS